MKKKCFSTLADFKRRHRLGKLSVSMCSVAGFSLPGFWQEQKSVLFLGAFVVLVIVIFVWLILRRRRDSFPEITFKVDPPVSDKDMTMIENLLDNQPRSTLSPGIYGKIDVIVGKQQINTYLITDNPLTIGRDPAQALAIIQEPIISKLHCSIFFRAGQVFIKDLDSTNGTYLNENKVSEQELNDNDIVFLGKKGTVKLIYHK